ncbi:MAG: DMT family transporter [Gammaproteobacteria bacterium]|nr:DMT family transporter [Gammaproteobacteria bacterium]MBT7603363.1 DMT family transporter [Gammaproteobacteria bacterium]
MKWFFFTLLVVMFGSAFLLIELSLISFQPIMIAFYRVTIAAFILYIYSYYKNYSFNFFKDNFKLLFILGLTGTSLPFYLISWAQVTITSSETGILIGFMPLFTIIGSHYYFKYEILNFSKIFGFIIGFFGLLILAFHNESDLAIYGNLLAKFAVILGAFFYALNALLVKKIKDVNIIPLSASVMFLSSLQLLICILLFDNNGFISQKFEFIPVISLLFMGIFSTAIATVIYYKIIHDYGPSFSSLVNYPIPIFSVFLGVVFLNENLSIYSILSLCLVMLAIYISQRELS